jgi:phage tail-like protein
MAEFTVNPSRRDPYKNFKFRVKWEGQYVAGFSKVSGLKKTTEVIEWRNGAEASVVRKLMGRTSYQQITLEAGVTHDVTFQTWANQVNNNDGSDASMDLSKYRKNIIIELLNEQGTKVIAYNIYSCWVMEYQALPDLDTSAHAVAITSLKIDCDRWERDASVTEPLET